MPRRTTGFPPMAHDGSGRRRRQLGPALTSGSGAPSYATPPWSLVALPVAGGIALAVHVNGTPQTEGIDFVVVDGSLVFERALQREPRLRHWLRVLRSPATRPARRDDRVDVWLGSAEGVHRLRDLPVQRRP